jgi:hypothetical protein
MQGQRSGQPRSDLMTQFAVVSGRSHHFEDACQSTRYSE